MGAPRTTKNPYIPILYRGDRVRIKGTMAKIRVVTGRINARDGDLIEEALIEMLDRLRAERQDQLAAQTTEGPKLGPSS